MRSIAIPVAAALLGLFSVPGGAAAANAITTSEVNMRAGPSTSFPVVQVVPDDVDVTVYGCVTDYEWCDVSWGDARGWVSADYLDAYSQDSYVPFYDYAPGASVPLIAFAFDTYWDNYYRGRPWYGRRGHWRDYWNHNHERIQSRWHSRHNDRAQHPRGPGHHRAHDGRPASNAVLGKQRSPNAGRAQRERPAASAPHGKPHAQTPHRAQRHINRAPRSVKQSRPNRAVHRAPSRARSMGRPARHAAPHRAAPRRAAPHRAAPPRAAPARAAPRAARGGGGGGGGRKGGPGLGQQ